MADAVKNGAAPKAVATYMEPESLAAWQTGKPAFMRNWPYAYALSQDDAEAQGQVRRRAAARRSRAPARRGILGGGNSVISRYSKNPGGALAWSTSSPRRSGRRR